MKMSTASIIVISYNSQDCIESCLRSAETMGDFELVLVDNASTDATVEIARRVAPNIRMLLNQRNIGFAGAVNQAVRTVESGVLVILNPDTIASPASLTKLAEALSNPAVGAAGGLLVHMNGKPDKGFAVRRFPTLGSAVAEVCLLNRIWPNNPLNRSYRCLDLDYTKSQEVDQPAGACLAVKRAAWEQVSGFDEDFFPVWFEDVDFCRRLRDHGWKIVYCPEAVFLHSGGHSVKKVPIRERQAYWYKNLLRYFAKHHSRSEVICLRVAIVAGLLLRSLLCLLGFRPAGIARHEAIRAYSQTAWNCGVRGEGATSSANAAAANSVA